MSLSLIFIFSGFFCRGSLDVAVVITFCTSFCSKLDTFAFLRPVFSLQHRLPWWPNIEIMYGKSSELRNLFTDTLNKVTQMSHAPLRISQVEIFGAVSGYLCGSGFF